MRADCRHSRFVFVSLTAGEVTALGTSVRNYCPSFLIPSSASEQTQVSTSMKQVFARPTARLTRAMSCVGRGIRGFRITRNYQCDCPEGV